MKNIRKNSMRIIRVAVRISLKVLDWRRRKVDEKSGYDHLLKK